MILCASKGIPSSPSVVEVEQAVGLRVPPPTPAKAPLTPTLSPIADGGEGAKGGWLLHALIGLLLCLFAGSAFAVDPLPFRDAAEEARFRELAAELRCVMCQNQSLADSNAPIAQDLRREVLELMQQGKTDEQIKAFLTERYTDFVLYRPAMSGSTLWIWIAPPLIFLVGAVFVFVLVRRRSSAAAATPASEDGDAW